MTIHQRGENGHIRLTTRGRVLITIIWTAVLLAGMLTANVGLPGWGQ